MSDCRLPANTLRPLRRPNILKLPLSDKESTMDAAAMLQRITGDRCAAFWCGQHAWQIIRQEPGGRIVRG